VLPGADTPPEAVCEEAEVGAELCIGGCRAGVLKPPGREEAFGVGVDGGVARDGPVTESEGSSRDGGERETYQ